MKDVLDGRFSRLAACDEPIFQESRSSLSLEIVSVCPLRTGGFTESRIDTLHTSRMAFNPEAVKSPPEISATCVSLTRAKLARVLAKSVVRFIEVCVTVPRAIAS